MVKFIVKFMVKFMYTSKVIDPESFPKPTILGEHLRSSTSIVVGLGRGIIGARVD